MSPRAPPPATPPAAAAPIDFTSLALPAPILTDYGFGALLAVRAGDGFLDVALPFGRAFVRPSAVVVFARGARVSTDFGRGRVEAAEVRPGAGLMYRVTLLDCKLANGGVAVGVFNVRAVAPRRLSAGFTFEEAVEDSDKTRLAGNEAYTSGLLGRAIGEYRRCQLQLQEAGRAAKGALSDTQKDLLREKFVTAACNLCTAYNKDGREESYRSVLDQAEGVRGARGRASRARALQPRLSSPPPPSPFFFAPAASLPPPRPPLPSPAPGHFFPLRAHANPAHHSLLAGA
jgi:hypothetical protein